MSELKAVITGMGCITPHGYGPNALWKDLFNDRSCIKEGLGKINNSLFNDLCQECSPYLNNKNGNLQAQELINIKPIIISLASIREALDNAGWKKLEPSDGLIIATTTGLVSSWEMNLINYLKSDTSEQELLKTFYRGPLGFFLGKISNELNFSGKQQLITTACAASTQALAIAMNWITTKKVRRCLVGGVETLSNLTVQGFKSLKLISNKMAKPFDKDRQGINLSEGAAFLCLESLENVKKNPLAAIIGTGLSCDAYHMTSPHPEGIGHQRAIKMALEAAKLNPQEISWIHAHGTGSIHNDLSEGNAINKIFGKDSPPVTSTKAIHGHALGASGIIETIACIKALNCNKYLKTAGLSNPDPEIKIKHALMSRNYKNLSLKNILKSTLAFGGINASIIISKV